MSKQKRISGILAGILILGMLFIAVFPVYWMISTSLKTSSEIFSPIPNLVPRKLTWDNYTRLFQRYRFQIPMWNSLKVALGVSTVSTVFSVMAAYVLARIRFGSRNAISQGILVSYLMPRTILFIPLYLIVTSVGLANSTGALFFVYPTITIPYATWVLIAHFKGIPVEIEEAAFVDGCNQLQALRKVVLPVASPGIVSTFIFSFTLCWSEYIYALVMINNEAASTITLSLSNMIVADVLPWGPLMAGAVIASIPAVVIYVLASRLMISGLTLGAVKG